MLLDRQLPAGPWDAQVKLTSGLLIEQARGSLMFPASNSSGAAPALAVAVHPRSFPTVPVAGAVAVAAVVAVVQVRRRRRGARP